MALPRHSEGRAGARSIRSARPNTADRGTVAAIPRPAIAIVRVMMITGLYRVRLPADHSRRTHSAAAIADRRRAAASRNIGERFAPLGQKHRAAELDAAIDAPAAGNCPLASPHVLPLTVNRITRPATRSRVPQTPETRSTESARQACRGVPCAAGSSVRRLPTAARLQPTYSVHHSR